jgi:PEP-CTERM motif
MRLRAILLAMATACLSLAASGTAMAQTIVTFDERGTGGSNVGPVISSGVIPDPLAIAGSGHPTATLAYTLPFPVVTGDVQLTENPTGVSDLVRFEGTMVFFYSDNTVTSDPAEPLDLADVGLPILLPPGTPVVLPETGSEGGFQGVTYVPAAGAPGFPLAAVPLPVIYNITSDVPEPTSLLLAGFGGSALLLAMRKRHCTLKCADQKNPPSEGLD